MNNQTDFIYIPVSEIVERKILTRATILTHAKNGKFALYKLGGRVFVRKDEFEAAFEKKIVQQAK